MPEPDGTSVTIAADPDGSVLKLMLSNESGYVVVVELKPRAYLDLIDQLKAGWERYLAHFARER